MNNKEKHPGPKDCIGIRISINGADYNWVVDDTNYNKGFGDAFWTLGIIDSERAKYKPVTIKKPFKVLKMSRIVFDGYYGGMLHFSYVERSGLSGKNKQVEFKFDGKPEVVQISGYRFTIYHADSDSIIYENMGSNQ